MDEFHEATEAQARVFVYGAALFHAVDGFLVPRGRFVDCHPA